MGALHHGARRAGAASQGSSPEWQKGAFVAGLNPVITGILVVVIKQTAFRKRTEKLSETMGVRGTGRSTGGGWR